MAHSMEFLKTHDEFRSEVTRVTEHCGSVAWGKLEFMLCDLPNEVK